MRVDAAMKGLRTALGTARGRAVFGIGALFFGLGWLPPLSQPTYELALVAGIVCPATAAVVTALHTSSRRLDGFASYCRGVGDGVSVALSVLVVALLHGVRTQMCDPLGGVVAFALGPGVGAALGGLWGVVAGELARSRKRPHLAAVVLAVAGPIVSILGELALFYGSPAVFAYDPFVGYFSGALYDTVLADDGLWQYRAASACTMAAAYVAALHLERKGERLRWVSLRRPGVVAFGIACAVARLAVFAMGPELGFWQTASTIEDELGARVVEGRCVVVFDRGIDRDHIARFARDCDDHVTGVSTWLGITDPAPVTAFVFRSRSQKKRLMGAAGTSIAKPWRREVYLNDLAYPHRVVEHELVHALAADLGHGPFRIAGELGGWLPNPGLIEGLAMAGAPRDEELSADGWAAQMKDLGVLPPLESLFSLSFFTSASSTGYTAAGSFVAFVRAGYGADVVGRWYGGEEITVLTGKSWAELEADWHAHLDTITRDDAAALTAQRRFDRPSVLARRCPHVVDERLDEADAQLGASDYDGAERIYEGVHGLDPDSERARFGLAECSERRGETETARSRLDAIAADDRYTEYTRDRAREGIADMDLRLGHNAEAAAVYRQLADRSSDEGRQRTFDLLAHYADDPHGRAALLALLIGTTHKGADDVEALDRIGRWRAAAHDDGTPSYLMGRQHFNRGHYDLAIASLEEAQRRGGLRPLVDMEVARLLVISHCARGQRPEAQAAFARYAASPAVRPSRREHLERLVKRCRG